MWGAEEQGLPWCWCCFELHHSGRTLKLSRHQFWNQTGNANLTGLSSQEEITALASIDILDGRPSPHASVGHRLSFLPDTALLQNLVSLMSDFARTPKIYRILFYIRIGISKSFFTQTLNKCIYATSSWLPLSLCFSWILYSVLFFHTVLYSFFFGYATLQVWQHRAVTLCSDKNQEWCKLISS